MDITAIFGSDIYNWVIIPLLIFFARIIDVSIGTIRVVFIAKGFKKLAPLLGFFEVIIWLLAIRQIMSNLTNFMAYIAYGAGFAAGTYMGIYLEEKLSFGKVLIRVITKRDARPLLEELKKNRYQVTGIEGEGNTGKVKLIFMIIQRSQVKQVVEIIKSFNPNAYYSIEDVKFAVDDSIPTSRSFWEKLRSFHVHRKGK